MPVVGDALQFETRLTQLRLLCEEAGRPDIGITACTWEIDEKLMARYAELGAARLVLYVPTQDKSVLESFLDRYLDVAGERLFLTHVRHHGGRPKPACSRGILDSNLAQLSCGTWIVYRTARTVRGGQGAWPVLDIGRGP